MLANLLILVLQLVKESILIEFKCSVIGNCIVNALQDLKKNTNS